MAMPKRKKPTVFPSISSFASFSTMMMMMMMMMIAGISGADANQHQKQGSYKKLFVFGDSYADTGNLGKLGPVFTRCWYEPYGTTFPQRPTGRFSDGRVFTDYFASFLGIKSPMPYKDRNMAFKLLPYGMNFAVGGSGVFDTGNFQRDLGRQIDLFESQIKGTRAHLHSSIALVSIAGNDYVYYESRGGDFTHVFEFMDSLINQLKVDLKRIHDLGVRKVVVNNLHPLGCTPILTKYFNYEKCNALIDYAVGVHNMKLETALDELRNATRSTDFVSLDIYSAFKSVIGQGTSKFKNGLKPCCQGLSEYTSCAQVDENGVKQYRLCSNARDSFYWDSLHPTQAAWAAVLDALIPSMANMFH